MSIPFEPLLFGIRVNIHLIVEYLAFFIAFRYYSRLRNATPDHISNKNRLSIILGAIVGAFLGSRLVGFLENPLIEINPRNLVHLLNSKSIMGGLFGGLIGVEITKIIIHECRSSGDLFTFPIIVGIAIGRLGCFLSGVKEFTYGKTTDFVTGMNLGDGLRRHPTSLYEIVFLCMLFIMLKKTQPRTEKSRGTLFKMFMVSYFGFRFLIEFIKPNVFFVFGLSSIQWLCVTCILYYTPSLKNWIKNAH